MKLFLDLFISFFQIGMFSVGGGYAAMPLIEEQVVNIHSWLSLTQFSDLITISEMTPGPITLNSATFVGLQVAGLPGAVVATVATIVPSFIIVSALAYVYYRYSSMSIIQGVIEGLRPTVVALIATAGLTIVMNAIGGADKAFNAFLIVFSLVLVRKFKKDPILIIMLTGLAGIIKAFILR